MRRARCTFAPEERTIESREMGDRRERSPCCERRDGNRYSRRMQCRRSQPSELIFRCATEFLAPWTVALDGAICDSHQHVFNRCRFMSRQKRPFSRQLQPKRRNEKTGIVFAQLDWARTTCRAQLTSFDDESQSKQLSGRYSTTTYLASSAIAKNTIAIYPALLKPS